MLIWEPGDISGGLLTRGLILSGHSGIIKEMVPERGGSVRLWESQFWKYSQVGNNLEGMGFTPFLPDYYHV
jgi:hypothetical protein